MALSVPLQRTFQTDNHKFSQLIGDEICIVLRSALRVGRADALWKTHFVDLHFTYDRKIDLLHRRYTLIEGFIDTPTNLRVKYRDFPNTVDGISYLAANQTKPAPPPNKSDAVFTGVIFTFTPINDKKGLHTENLVVPSYVQLSAFAPRYSNIGRMPLLPDWVAHLKMVLAKDYPRRIEDTFRDDAVASGGSTAA
ncbi:hypothetical protein RQP46_008519 [Phenoliferia psychrophenolica]